MSKPRGLQSLHEVRFMRKHTLPSGCRSPGCGPECQRPTALTSGDPRSNGTSGGSSPHSPPTARRKSQDARTSIPDSAAWLLAYPCESGDPSNRATADNRQGLSADIPCSMPAESSLSHAPLCVSQPRQSATASRPVDHVRHGHLCRRRVVPSPPIRRRRWPIPARREMRWLLRSVPSPPIRGRATVLNRIKSQIQKW